MMGREKGKRFAGGYWTTRTTVRGALIETCKRDLLCTFEQLAKITFLSARTLKAMAATDEQRVGYNSWHQFKTFILQEYKRRKLQAPAELKK